MEMCPMTALHSLMRKIERDVAGGEGVEGTYGSITAGGTHDVLEAMYAAAPRDSDSMLVDVGAGLGRPLLHAACMFGARGYGIEYDHAKVCKAETMVERVFDNIRTGHGHTLHCQALAACQVTPPPIIHGNIEEVKCLALDKCPAIHAYTFWPGWSERSKRALGKLVYDSPTLKAIAVVDRFLRDPEGHLAALGFGQWTVAKPAIPVRMSGSGSQFKAYIFYRSGVAGQCTDTVVAPIRSSSVEASTIDWLCLDYSALVREIDEMIEGVALLACMAAS